MRPCSSALATFLDGTPEAVALTDLYLFQLADGTQLRFTGGNFALTVPSAGFADAHSLNYGANRTFLLGPGFGRSKISTKVGVEPAELDIDIYAGPNNLIGGTLFTQAVREGQFDGATVELDRLFGTTPQDTSLGVMTWFYGRVADCDVGRSKISMKVKSLMNLLAIQQMPRRLYQASCSHVFGDTMCGYNRVTGVAADGTTGGPAQVNVTAASGSTPGLINATGAVPNYIDGTITCVSGANAGASRTIANNGSGSQVGMFRPFLSAITAGDTFTLLPGCDHSTGSGGCAGRNNLLRFGGFPYIPPPEAAI